MSVDSKLTDFVVKVRVFFVEMKLKSSIFIEFLNLEFLSLTETESAHSAVCET